jgi:hypothetical protein
MTPEQRILSEAGMDAFRELYHKQTDEQLFFTWIHLTGWLGHLRTREELMKIIDDSIPGGWRPPAT